MTIYNLKLDSQIKMTVVIAQKGLIEKCEEIVPEQLKDYPYNCYVPFRIKGTDITALGVHSHSAFECREYVNYVGEKFNLKFNLILGDFNSGNYTRDSDDSKLAVNRKNYLLLTDGYIDLCQGKHTTEWKTYIDHVLLKSNYNFLSKHKCRDIVVQELDKSDHYPITFKLDYFKLDYEDK